MPTERGSHVPNPRPDNDTGKQGAPKPQPSGGNSSEWGSPQLDSQVLVPGTYFSFTDVITLGLTNPQKSWETWLDDTAAQNPAFAAMQQMYGDEFVQYAWQHRGDTAEQTSAEFLRRGWSVSDAMKRFGGRGGGRGGSSRAAMVRSLEAEIRNLARTLGVPMDDEHISRAARTAVAGNWSSAMIEDYVVGSTFSDWGELQQGFLTNTVEQIKQAAQSQLVTMSDETARDYAKRAATSEFSLSTLDSILKEQAKQRYAWAAPALDAGMTMADYTRPMRDTIAQELEVSADQIDLMDGKWMDMLQTDVGGGQIRAATQAELVKRARKLPEFAGTSRAADMSASVATYLRQYLGA